MQPSCHSQEEQDQDQRQDGLQAHCSDKPQTKTWRDQVTEAKQNSTETKKTSMQSATTGFRQDWMQPSCQQQEAREQDQDDLQVDSGDKLQTRLDAAKLPKPSRTVPRPRRPPSSQQQRESNRTRCSRVAKAKRNKTKAKKTSKQTAATSFKQSWMQPSRQKKKPVASPTSYMTCHKNHAPKNV